MSEDKPPKNPASGQPVQVARESSPKLIEKLQKLTEQAQEDLAAGNVKSAEICNKQAQKILRQIDDPKRQGSHDR